VAIVTGGGSGLGRAIAVELSRCGAAVVVAGRRMAPLHETAALCGERCWAHRTDVREEAEVDGLVDAVLERHGHLDVVVNNAGGQFLAPAEMISANGFRAVIRLNLEGTWLLISAAATKAFIPQRRGKIINVTLSPHHGLPGMSHSAAARAAVENLTRTLSTEWARFGVSTVSIALGTFATDALDKYPGPVREAAGSVAPMQRLGRPEEAAWLVAFAASRAGDFLSGGVITLDGGRDNWPGAWPPDEMTGADGQPLAEGRRY
jgi:citronellol/citronellal dehydrogenase